jgi:G patch domain-containing protein 1
LLLLLSVSVVKTMGSDEEDFVFHGTPIEREEEIASRKKKAVAGASGNLRTLPAWKQEVSFSLIF